MSHSRDVLPWAGFDRVVNSDSAAMPFSEYGESMTVQSMAEDADINVLMKRFGITGVMPENPRVPQYGDFEHITDFRSAIHAVRDAEASFAELPASARAFFNNDPQLLLEFASNPVNLPKLKELGLAKEVVSGGSTQGSGGANTAPGGQSGAAGVQPGGDKSGAPGGSAAPAGGSAA